jgi:hypothetical protein
VEPSVLGVGPPILGAWLPPILDVGPPILVRCTGDEHEGPAEPEQARRITEDDGGVGPRRHGAEEGELRREEGEHLSQDLANAEAAELLQSAERKKARCLLTRSHPAVVVWDCITALTLLFVAFFVPVEVAFLEPATSVGDAPSTVSSSWTCCCSSS